MAIDCTDICGKIASEMAVDCNSVIITGVEQAIILINRCDIDSYTLDVTTSTHKVTAITLKSGSTGYLMKGYAGKQLFFASHSVQTSDDGPDDVIHTVGLRGYNLTEANLVYIRELMKGADLVAITLDKTDSTDVNAYKVYGLQNGLKLSEYNQATNESKGAFIYTIASRDPDFESYPPLVWLETDRATTDAKFDIKLAVA